MMLGIALGWLGLGGCTGGAPQVAPEPEVPPQCRNVHLDRLSADWLAVRGARADHKMRLRVLTSATAGVDYEAWYTGGFFTKMRLTGVKRERDVMFTEVPAPEKAKRVQAGETTLTRMYLEPSLEDCALEVFVGTVDAKDREALPPKPVEFVIFPEQPGVTFSFRPPDRPLFLGTAARDRAKAAKQMSEGGGPKPDHELGTVPVGLWTKAEEDGPEGCAFAMDLYFDDQLHASDVTAGAVSQGYRHWYYEWEAPYSGNHNFEIYRYRACEGSDRELIDVAALEAVLL